MLTKSGINKPMLQFYVIVIFCLYVDYTDVTCEHTRHIVPIHTWFIYMCLNLMN